MGIFDNFVYRDGTIIDCNFVKWIHFDVPDKEGKERKTKRDNLELLKHCKPCTALSGCYFEKSNLPKKKADGDGLLHPHCDCTLKTIYNPQVKAFCNVKKFSEYVFGEKYAYNGKARLFKQLGFDVSDSESLKFEFEKQAKQKYLTGEYEIRNLDREYGQDINIVIEITSSTGRSVKLNSGWKVHPLGLITCNTPLADD